MFFVRPSFKRSNNAGISISSLLAEQSELFRLYNRNNNANDRGTMRRLRRRRFGSAYRRMAVGHARQPKATGRVAPGEPHDYDTMVSAAADDIPARRKCGAQIFSESASSTPARFVACRLFRHTDSGRPAKYFSARTMEGGRVSWSPCATCFADVDASPATRSRENDECRRRAPLFPWAPDR